MSDQTRSVTIDHVAAAAGVSRSTASRVLSGSGSRSTPTGARVRAAADELGYVPNPLAQALARGLGTRVVVAVCSTSPEVGDDPYVASVVSGTAAVCNPEGVGVSLQWLPLGSSAPLHQLALDRSVRGVILINTTDQLLAEMPAGLRGRVASIGIGSSAVPSFDVDNGAAGAAIVSHLYLTGRRRIVMIAGPEWLPCSHRPVEAYRAVLRSAGLEPRILPGDFSVRSGRDGAVEALRRWPGTDAIFASCDATALGALAALRERGVRVPGDVAVTGFDDIPFAALSSPALTTSTHPVTRIAAGAARAVLDPSCRSPIAYSSQLVLRESA